MIGTLQFQGVSLDFPNVALWLDRMVNVDGWANAWVSSAASASTQESQPGGTAPSAAGVQFTGTVDLTPETAQNGTAP